MTTELSKHYINDRAYREDTIKKYLGDEGTVIFITTAYDKKRKARYRYEITDKAVLIVKLADNSKIITKMMARPSRIKKYWWFAPQEILDIACENSRNPERFA